ncbi:MAG: type II toxin-antitoxin system VapB family antitoxin [Eubacteriales bacterium]|nr:type II toxin-antitoxin system VapB family antitoxin [Eubacteriales bacterium]
METAKIFTNGGSQAVRLPKSCQFKKEKEVLVKKIGNAVILLSPEDPWSSMMAALDCFTEDYLKEEIEDLPVQEREQL